MSKHDLATNLISLFVVFVNDALETSFTFLLRGGQDFALIKFVKWMAIEHSSYRMALLLITRVLFIRRVIFSTHGSLIFGRDFHICGAHQAMTHPFSREARTIVSQKNALIL